MNSLMRRRWKNGGKYLNGYRGIQSSSRKVPQLVKLLSLLLITILCILLRISISFPSVDDFIYYNIAHVVEIGKFGHFPADLCSIPGFITLVASIHIICGIPYAILLSLPLLSVPLILLLYIVVKRISKESSRAIVIVMGGGISSFFITLFCHGIGTILVISLIFLCLLRLSNPHKTNNIQSGISILIIILIISLNYISYQQMAFSIMLLAFLEFIIYIQRKKTSKLTTVERGVGFLNVFIVGLIFCAVFNQFLYNGFIPMISSSLESDSMSGIEKLFMILIKQQSKNSLSIYQSQSPPIQSTYAHVAAYALLGIALITSGVRFFQNIIKKRPISAEDALFFGVICASTILFFIYSTIGGILISTFTLSGMIGLALLSSPHNKKKLRRLAVFCIISIFVLNTYATLECYRVSFPIGGQKDDNYFQYLDSPSEWFWAHITENQNEGVISNWRCSADVFTSGCFSFKGAEKNTSISSGHLDIFSEKEILSILDPQKERSPYYDDTNHLFIINQKAKTFSIEGWNTFNGWSHYTHQLNMNPYLSCIYSSGGIEVYKTSHI